MVTLQLTTKEIVKLISIINSAIAAEIKGLMYLSEDSDAAQSCRVNIDCCNALNHKIHDTIVQSIGSPKENIHNDLQYADDPELGLKNYNGGLIDADVSKVYEAIDIIKNMWAPTTGGFKDSDKYYQYIDFIYTKQECLDALEIVKKFIEEFAPDVKEGD